LDGIHPTPRGAAIIANECRKAVGGEIVPLDESYQRQSTITS
jgi:hypothetical protein